MAFGAYRVMNFMAFDNQRDVNEAFDKQSDMNTCFSVEEVSLVASPKQSLSKICGYRPHKVSQIESLPQTWVIKPTMLARSEDKRRAYHGQRRAVCERGERARDSARERPNTARKYASKQPDSTVSTCRSCSHS